MKKIYLLVSIVFFLSGNCLSQTILEQRVSISVKEVTLENALFQLVDKAGVKLSFSSEIIPEKLVSIKLRRQELRHVLDVLFEGSGIAYKIIGSQLVLFKIPKLPGEQKFTISGFLEDAQSGERLISASVYDEISQKGAITNEYGFYSLTLSSGEVSLTFSYLGFQAELRRFMLNFPKHLNLSLQPSLTLAEIIVVARDSMPEEKKNGISADFINVGDVERLPSLAGESDLIRTAHLLPGVQTGTDGVGGIFVRGGDSGQNLILIDGVPVYNISHAAGVFSIFNTAAIRSAKLVKGGFPARYGGRLSSVLDVRTKEGNMKTFKARADMGLLTGRFSLEGPIVKDKSSFFVSTRRSFLNWYIQPYTRNLKNERGEDGATAYLFYDVNAKLNYTFSDQDKVYLSFYGGSDRFQNNGESSQVFSVRDNNNETFLFRFDQSYSERLKWGNRVAALRWNHLFSNKLFANSTFTYSKLGVNTNYHTVDSLLVLDPEQTIGKALNFGRYSSSIEDVGAKIDFDFIPSTAHYFRFGIGVTRHSFKPGALIFDEATANELGRGSLSNEAISSTEYIAYVEDDISFGANFYMNIGVHAATLSVENKNYRSIQPRISTYWKLAKNTALKASYSRMTQFLHLLSSSGIGLPTDLWVPTTSKVKPQQSWQTVLGIDYQIARKYKVSLETYYKRMKGLLNYSEGAFFLNDWQENVTSGEGRAYGVEFQIKKQSGKTRGWVAYSLSWADRQFDKVNLGRRFPFKYDRRHDLKIVMNHNFRPWLELSTNWIWSSGFAFSIPLTEYYFQVPGQSAPPVIALDFGSKNQYRMPYYRRLDVSLNFYFHTSNIAHVINVGVYNLTSRKNPLYFDLRTKIVNENNELKEVKEFVQVWLLPILPSFNYTLKF